MRPPDPQLTAAIKEALATFELRPVDRLAALGATLCAAVPRVLALANAEAAALVEHQAERAARGDANSPRAVLVLRALGRHRFELLLGSRASQVAPLLGSDWESCAGLHQELPSAALYVADITLRHPVLQDVGATRLLDRLVGALQELCLTGFEDAGGGPGLTSAPIGTSVSANRGLAIAHYLVGNAQAERDREVVAALDFVREHLLTDGEGGAQ
jgi:hypothetical protein